MSISTPHLSIIPGAPALYLTQWITPQLVKVGTMIRSVTADQIKRIANRMCAVLSQNFTLNGNVMFQRGYLKDHTGRIIALETYNIKDDFLSRTPFEQDMQDHFQFGSGSIIAQGGVHEYSYEDILNYSVQTGGGEELRKAIEIDIEERAQYRISLGLDLQQTERKSELVFLITEKNGVEELSKTFFTLRGC